MSDDENIELELDQVFPPRRSRSTSEDKPPSPKRPRRTLPPPPPIPQAIGAMERLQEDVDLVIDATGRRLDTMERQQAEFEKTIRGVSGAQERRLRDFEDRLERTQRMMLELTRKLRDIQASLDDHQHGIDEMRARNTIAAAKIEELQVSGQLALVESDLRTWREERGGPIDPESTTRLLRG